MSNSAKEFNPLPVIYEALEKDAKERASWMPPESVVRARKQLPKWVFENSPRMEDLYFRLTRTEPRGEQFYGTVSGFIFQALAEIAYTEECERRSTKDKPEIVLSEKISAWMIAELRAERYSQIPTRKNALRMRDTIFRTDHVVLDANGAVLRVVEHTTSTFRRYFRDKKAKFNTLQAEEPETFGNAKLAFTTVADSEFRQIEGVAPPKRMEHISRRMVADLAKRFYLTFRPAGCAPLIQIFDDRAWRFKITEAELLAHLPERQEGEIITNMPSARPAYSY